MGSEMYNEREFYAAYKSFRNDRSFEVRTGERKSIGNITKGIVDRQAYSNSKEYARNIADAYERTRKLTGELKKQSGLYTKIRYGAFDIKGSDSVLDAFWNEVSKIRKSYLDSGLSGSEAYNMLAVQVFGSN